MPKDANEPGESNATGRWLKRLKRSVAEPPGRKSSRVSRSA